MIVNKIQIHGDWELGYVLDKHVESSKFIEHDQNGIAQFDTTRTEAGEAMFQLKYRSDYSKVNEISLAVVSEIIPLFDDIHIVIPMPSSNTRSWQPVHEIAKSIADNLCVIYRSDFLLKNGNTKQMKDFKDAKEKAKMLLDKFSCSGALDESCNILLVDDLYATGSTLKAACGVLSKCDKIKKIYVAAITRTKG